VHSIHEGANARGPGRTLLSDFDPHISTRRAKARIVINLVNALMQRPAGFNDLKLYSHG